MPVDGSPAEFFNPIGVRELNQLKSVFHPIPLFSLTPIRYNLAIIPVTNYNIAKGDMT